MRAGLLLILLLCSALVRGGSTVETPAQASLAANWLTQAMALERRQDWDALLDWGRWWTQAEPAMPTAWFVLGRAYAQQQRYPEAIAAYHQNLRLAPGDAQAWNNLGNVYHRSGRFREALFAYRDATRGAPGFRPAWQGLGSSYFQLLGAPGIVQALERLRAVDPPLALAWQHLLMGYGSTQDPRMADEAFQILRDLEVPRRERMFTLLFTDI